jgi:hypothetical protein
MKHLYFIILLLFFSCASNDYEYESYKDQVDYELDTLISNAQKKIKEFKHVKHVEDSIMIISDSLFNACKNDSEIIALQHRQINSLKHQLNKKPDTIRIHEVVSAKEVAVHERKMAPAPRRSIRSKPSRVETVFVHKVIVDSSWLDKYTYKELKHIKRDYDKMKYSKKKPKFEN